MVVYNDLSGLTRRNLKNWGSFMKGDSYGETLIKEGFVRVPLPFYAPAFDRAIGIAIKGFNALLTSNDWPKWECHAEGDDKPDDGCIRRDGDDGKGKLRDYKYFFHYRPELLNLLAAQGVHPTAQQRTWLNWLHVLYQIGLCTMQINLGTLDAVMPGYNFGYGLHRPQHRLRLLRYDLPLEREKGAIIGQQHADKSFFTLHMMDSREGLRLYREGKDDEHPRLYYPVKNHVLWFPGAAVENYTGGRLRAMYHDVVETDPTQPAGRWSVVMFFRIDSVAEPVV